MKRLCWGGSLAASLMLIASVAVAQQQQELTTDPNARNQAADAAGQQAPVGQQQSQANDLQNDSVLDNTGGETGAQRERTLMRQNNQLAQPGLPAPEQPARAADVGADQDQSSQQRGVLGVWLVGSAGPGVEIRRVTPGSAADEAGVQPGDILLQVEGQGITSPAEAQDVIGQRSAGETIVLEIWRDGQQFQAEASLRPPRDESYRVGYRGNGQLSESDLAQRTMRLEEQVGMVMQELQRMRQELAELRASRSGLSGTSGALPPAQPGANALDQPVAPQPGATDPSASDPQQPGAIATEDDLFGSSATDTTNDASASEQELDASTSPAPSASGTTTPADDQSTAPADTEDSSSLFE